METYQVAVTGLQGFINGLADLAGGRLPSAESQLAARALIFNIQSFNWSAYGIWWPVLRVTFLPRDILWVEKARSLRIEEIGRKLGNESKTRGEAASNKPLTCLRRGLTTRGLALLRCPSFGFSPSDQTPPSTGSAAIIVAVSSYVVVSIATLRCIPDFNYLLNGCHPPILFRPRFPEC